MKRIAATVVALAAVIAPGAANAADPGLWVVTGTNTFSSSYRQGLAGDPSGNVFFSGSFSGIHKTRNLVELASIDNVIPADVQQREQYNHIGDIAWDAGEGGRILLPLESYQPFQKDQNPSKTGSIGVLSAATLEWSYYVKLDPSEIAKTQWVATTADGLVWTVTGSDLLAYRLADVTLANAAPTAAPIHSVRRIPGVVAGGAGGAAELGGRLYLSTDDNGVDGIASVDLASGTRRVEFERPGTLEAEGVDVGPYLGGILHVEFTSSGLGNAQLWNLLPKDTPLRLRLAHGRIRAGRTAKLRATAVAVANGAHVPLAGVHVRIGRARATTNAAGVATLKLTLKRGLHRARASFSGLRSATAKLRAI